MLQIGIWMELTQIRKNLPNLLQPTEPVECYDDPFRPVVVIGNLIGVVVSKRDSPSVLLPSPNGGVTPETPANCCCYRYCCCFNNTSEGSSFTQYGSSPSVFLCTKYCRDCKCQHCFTSYKTGFVDDVPVPSSNSSVFPQTSCSSLDVSSIISKRLNAMRRLQQNPIDSEAIKIIYNSQSEMSSWASCKHLPGQFTGSSGVNVLKPNELNFA